MPILKEQVLAVLEGRRDYQTALEYYNGDIPEVFTTAKLRAAYARLKENPRLNFTRTIVNVVNDRLEVSSISTGDPAQSEFINSVWENNELDIEANIIHRNALIFGESYALVWVDDSGDWLVAGHTPLNMALVYDTENPRVKSYAVKLWKHDEKTHRLNIYYADRIEKYSARVTDVTEGTQWSRIGTEDNPFGQVPVFHFRTDRPKGRPEHYDAYGAQDAVNKHFINSMISVDYQAAPQRYALAEAGSSNETDDFNDGDTDRENANALKSDPGNVWYMKGIKDVGEFKPADPDVFWKPIMNALLAAAALTCTPMHYFDVGKGGLYGAAMRVAEAPMLKKVGDRKLAFGHAWSDLFKFILFAEGIQAKVDVFWKEVESLDESERWDITLKKVNAGLSHKQALREGGYSEEQIEAIMAERKVEADQGLYYQRVAQTRVNVSNSETNTINGVN